MAPANTPGRKRRENAANFFEPGVVGRRTGVTLKDLGARDEHGLEPLDGIFSSPEKSPRKPNARKGDVTITTSETMDVVQSSIPDPTEVLTERRLLQSNRTHLPPPKSRSPIKTNLGSSPRRHSSLAPQSHARHSLSTPEGASPLPTVSRRLDFAGDEPENSIEDHSPLVNGVSARSEAEPTDVYDLQPSPEQPDTRRRSRRLPERISLADDGDEDEDNVGLLGGGYDENATFGPEDESAELPNEDNAGSLNGIQDEPSAVSTAPESAPVKRRGRPPRSSEVGLSGEPPNQEPSATDARGLARKGRGRKPKETASVTAAAKADKPVKTTVGRKPNSKGKGAVSNGVEDPDQSERGESNSNVPEAKRRGRPQKSSKLDVHKDASESATEEAEPESSTKRARDEGDQPERAKKKRKTAMPPPSQRDPNAKITSLKSAKKTNGHAPENDANGQQQKESSRSGARQILRQGTPMEDAGSCVTRYGRTSIKPLAWYKGEHVRWAPRMDKDDLPTVQEIVRVEDIDEPVKKPGRRGRRLKREMTIIEEEEEPLEEWEENEGLLMGYVNGWDADAATVADDEMELAIAFASAALQTREVKGASFRFAKCLTLPFFGCGMVELPPKGFKKPKNSNKMQMVFFVHEGKVIVEVAGNQFTISKGGVWQVPRGNFYSIANASNDKSAKIFFAQGCEVIPEEEEDVREADRS